MFHKWVSDMIFLSGVSTSKSFIQLSWEESDSKMLVNLKYKCPRQWRPNNLQPDPNEKFSFQKCCMRLHSATLVSDMTIYSYDSLVTMRWSPDHSPEPSHGSPLSVEGQRPPVSGVSLRLLVRPWWHRGLQAESGQQVRPARPQETLQPGRRDGDW